MPMDWSILLCDEDFDGIEVLLASLNNRGFRVLVMNPPTTRTVEEIGITNVYQRCKMVFSQT